MIKNAVTIVLLFFFFFAFSVKRAIAATFAFYPSTITVPVNYPVSIDLGLNLEGITVKGADVAISYDIETLEVVGAPGSVWFSKVTSNLPNPLDTIYLRGTMDSPNPDISSGTFATLIVRGRKPGITKLSFACQPNSSTDTNVWDSSLHDTIDCEKTKRSTVSLIITDEQGRYPGEIPPGTFPPGEPSCDLCGACRSNTGITIPSNWEACRACIYNKDNTVKKGFAWTPIGCVGTQPGPIIGTIFRFLFPLSGGIAFLILLFGGFKVMTSRGDYDQLAAGRRLMIGAVVSLLLILFSFFIIRFVAVTILGIPGFG